MWERVELLRFSGPVRGFTFPRRDALLALTPDGLVRVALDPVEVHLVADADTLAAVYDPCGGILLWEDERHLVYDGDGGDITLRDHPCGDRIVPDADGTLLVTDPDEREVRQRITSIRIPTDGSWLYAGFSDDYKWLVAGEPSGVQVFRRVPAAEKHMSRD